MAAQVAIHYDEIGLKGGNRPFFERQLCRNVRTALEGVFPAHARSLYGRILLDVPDDVPWPPVERALRHVFGIAHFGRVVRADADLNLLIRRALTGLPRDPDRSFAVKAHRVNKRFPTSSQEIGRIVGAAIKEDRGWRVDLTNPDITVSITILGRDALMSWEKIPGPGGLPLGVSSRVACLLSGGIDSPVAAYKIMRRGAMPTFVHFHSYPLTDKSSQETARRLVEILLRGQLPRPLWLVPLGEIQQQIIAECRADLRVLLYRRFMVRLAAAIGRREGAQALVTGEVLGQVASQTLENLAAIEACAGLPILRPLIGFDKREIVELAGVLETYPVSAAARGDCCSYLLPEHPATRARADELEGEEGLLPVDGLLAEALKAAERLEVSGRFDDGGCGLATGEQVTPRAAGP